MTRKPRDHYEALGINRNANEEEIRKAYRKKAKENHPDSGGKGDIDAFHAAQEAYEELKDPNRRRAYDEELRREEHPGRFQRTSTSRRSSSSGRDPFSSPFDTNSGRPRGERSDGFSGGMDDLFQQEDELFGRILNELFGGGQRPGRSAFGGFGDMFSEDRGEEPFSGPGGSRRGHRHLRDEEPLSVVVHLSPDESYTGGTVSVDIGGGRSILASIPPGVRHGDVVRTEFYDSEGPRELKLHIRID